ncbi:MAG: MFS transporter [Novosphingobium sp.]|nr:MFS transporter [Novosphingobium sp.]
MPTGRTGATALSAFGRTFRPLARPDFRRLWIGVLCGNIAQQLLLVLANWTMLEQARAADKVALVQVAASLPVMLLALPGGALADVFDRRRIALVAVLVALAGALLFLLAGMRGALSPPLILASCFVAAIGSALLAPVWQSSLTELVGRDGVSAGVALNATSNNLSRAIGASAGGVLLIAVGVTGLSVLTVIAFLPLVGALLVWRRPPDAAKPTGEGLIGASLGGLRYALRSRLARAAVTRMFCAAVGTSAIYALLPVLAAAQLDGGPGTYGLLLGSFGLGAVASGLLAGLLRDHIGPETSLRLYSTLQAAALVVTAFSGHAWLTALAIFVGGICWVTNTAVFNVAIHLNAPRWIGGRMIALTYASAGAGLAAGSFAWGQIATRGSTTEALLCAAAFLALSPWLGLVLPLPPQRPDGNDVVPSPNRIVAAADDLHRPVQVRVHYAIPPAERAAFVALMAQMRQIRERNGARTARLFSDPEDAEHWVEVLEYRSWQAYLRARDRVTASERGLQDRASALQSPGIGIRIERLSRFDP